MYTFYAPYCTVGMSTTVVSATVYVDHELDERPGKSGIRKITFVMLYTILTVLSPPY